MRNRTKANEAVNVNKVGEQSNKPENKTDSDPSSSCKVQIENLRQTATPAATT